MIDIALDVLSWILLTLGGACVLIGGIGGLRLPNFYTRIHASSLTDTMATILNVSPSEQSLDAQEACTRPVLLLGSSSSSFPHPIKAVKQPMVIAARNAACITIFDVFFLNMSGSFPYAKNIWLGHFLEST